MVGRVVDRQRVRGATLTQAQKRSHPIAHAENGVACRAGVAGYLGSFNEEYPHSSLSVHTPDEVYCQSRINQPVA